MGYRKRDVSAPDSGSAFQFPRGPLDPFSFATLSSPPDQAVAVAELQVRPYGLEFGKVVGLAAVLADSILALWLSWQGIHSQDYAK